MIIVKKDMNIIMNHINTRRKLKIFLVLDKNKKLLRVFMRKFLENDTKCIKNRNLMEKVEG